MANPMRKRSGAKSVSSAAGPDERAWAQRCADRAWLDTHRDELYEQYPKHAIAVYESRVIAASTSEETMITEARRVAKANIGYVVVDYLQGPDEILLF